MNGVVMLTQQAAQASGYYYRHVSYSRGAESSSSSSLRTSLLSSSSLSFTSSSSSSSIGALKVSGLGQSRPLKKIKHVAVHAVAETDVCISLSFSLRVDYGFSNSAFWLTWICNFTRDGSNSPPYISSETSHRLSELFLLQACYEQRSVEARVW
jgi:hypothetical protein